jgi:hypothetical protein
MGATVRGALPYPEDPDEVNVPQDLKDLADALASKLWSADPKSSSTRPTLTSGDRGYLLDESDTGLLVRWNGTTWVTVGGTSGGGGGSVSGGRWQASTAQPIPATASGPGSPVAFATPPASPVAVTRSTYLSGHVFELTASALWHGVFNGRFASTNTSGVRDFSVACDRAGGTDFDEVLSAPMPATVVGQPKGGPYPFVRYLPAGTKVVVYAYNGTGSMRSLEHNGGEWVSLDLWSV